MKEELQNFLTKEEFWMIEEYYQNNKERFEAERMKNSLVQITL